MRSVGEAKPINIDFDLYTDNDSDFKHKLVVLMISNLNELQQALFHSLQNQDVQSFSKASHKVHATLVILDDADLDQVIAELKELLINKNNRDRLLQLANTLEEFCNGIIVSLEKEITTI